MGSLYLLTSIILAFCLIFVSVSSHPCTVCKGGLNFDESFANKSISLPLKPQTITLTCAMLDASLPFLVTNDTSETCSLIQSLGPVCGCPTPSDACTLCPDGSSSQSPNATLPFFEEKFGFIPTCELLEAYLQSEYKNESSMCTVSQLLLSNYCGCDGTTIETGCSFCPDGQSIGFPDKNLNITGIPLDTCQQLESALSLVVESNSQTCSDFQHFSSYCGCSVIENACEMCPHGSLAFPEKEVDVLLGGNTTGPLVPTCKIMEAIARSSKAETNECLLSKMIGGFCGCPPIDDNCLWCRSQGIPESYLDHEVLPEALKVVTGFQPAQAFPCKQAQSFLTQVARSDGLCDIVQLRGDICGCYEGGFGYFGTDGHPEKRTVASVLARISATLSIVAVIIICIDVLRDSNRRSNLYCQLMLGMSIFDFLYSMAWIAFSAPIPFDPVTSVIGASGNHATCQAQSFFFQLGLASILYNVSLNTYYFLMIVLSKREMWLKKQRWWLHGIPVGVGIALAGASIPFATNNYYGCHIPITSAVQTSTLILFIIPVIFVLCYCTFMILMIQFKVRKQNQKANRWRRPSSCENNVTSVYNSRKVEDSYKNTIFDKLQRQVSWQALLYLGSLWCTWPLFLVPFIAHRQLTREPWRFSFYALLFILAPLQGFLNALIYFRTRIRKLFCIGIIENPSIKTSGNSNMTPRSRRGSERSSTLFFFMKQIDLDEFPNHSENSAIGGKEKVQYEDEFDENLIKSSEKFLMISAGGEDREEMHHFEEVDENSNHSSHECSLDMRHGK